MKRVIPVLFVFSLLLCLLCACSDDTAAGGWTDGVVADGVYSNESLHMTFQIPDTWMEASEEETRSILGADESDSSTVYDVLIGTANGMEKMYVTCMDLRNTIGGSKLTQEEALQSVIDESGSDPVLSGAQYSEIGSLTVCGLEYAYADLDFDGELYQRIMMHKLSDKHLVLLGIVAASEAELEYYMAHFTSDPDSIPAPPEAVRGSRQRQFLQRCCNRQAVCQRVPRPPLHGDGGLGLCLGRRAFRTHGHQL